jgi:hypothetical protein
VPPNPHHDMGQRVKLVGALRVIDHKADVVSGVLVPT